MPRHRNLKREAHIRKLRGEGLNLHRIAEVVNVSVPTIRRALGLGSQPKQPREDRPEALENRVRTLEEQVAVVKDFMQITAKMSGSLGFTYRDQLTAILRRWPRPSASSLPAPSNSATEDVIVAVLSNRSTQGTTPE